ncbi:UNVERIFIED_CONTAM: aos [Trichonephila clavipes]
MAVCNRVDVYSTPWIERQCRCPGKRVCSMSTDSRDGYTVVDESRQLKLCEPVSQIPTCRYFRDVAWTYATFPDNTTKQTMHCVCPKNSVAYIFKHEIYNTPEGVTVLYFLACSPQSVCTKPKSPNLEGFYKVKDTKMRCQRKEPCRLFTVKKRPDVEEVSTNTLCQCQRGHYCPEHHSQPSVISSPSSFKEEHIRTYSGYCTSELS